MGVFAQEMTKEKRRKSLQDCTGSEAYFVLHFLLASHTSQPEPWVSTPHHIVIFSCSASS